MTIAILSDLHAHNFQQFSTTLDNGRNSRFQSILDVLDQFKEQCVAYNVQHVVFCGDMFHSRTKVDIDVFTATWLKWREISEVVESLYILTGNHDQYSKAGDVHSLEPFKAFAFVVDKPRVIVDKDFSFAAVPFVEHIPTWRRHVHKIVNEYVKEMEFFFFHQGVMQGLTGAFNITVPAEIDVDDLPTDTFKYCIGGHYHKHQFITSQVGYVGSPIQHNFGERGEDKGFLLYKDKELTFQKLNGPEFRLYHSEAELVTDLNLKEEDHVKVVCKTHAEAEKLVEKYRVQVEVQKVAQLEPARITKKEALDDKLLLERYIDLNNKNLDNNELIDMGLGMLQGDDE